MIKVDAYTLERMEEKYPAIKELIFEFENAVLPSCPHCGSEDTADVNVGIIGITIHISAATSKFKLIPNAPLPGEYFCNVCQKYFG